MIKVGRAILGLIYGLGTIIGTLCILPIIVIVAIVGVIGDSFQDKK